MVPELYLMSMPVFVRKSASNIRSYLISPSNTNALCWLTTLFLSSSGSHIARRTTISLAVHDLASVLTLRVLATGHGLQHLGRHLWEMKVIVDPGSNSTLRRVRDRIPAMVSHTMMLSGVSRALFGKVVPASFGLLASKMGKAWSWQLYHLLR